MKKTFPLTDPAHKPARVVERIKGDIRKYLKRERRKNLPENVDFWDFDCQVGESADSAEKAHVAELPGKIDQAAESGWAGVYVEILAIPGHRSVKEPENVQTDDSETEL